MSRWLLALLFAFGSVTFLTGCPAEEGGDDDAAGAADEAGDEAGDAADEAGDAADDATE